MTTLLLDFRWKLSAALDDSEALFSLQAFENLWRRTGLQPAPFIEDQDQADMWQQTGQQGRRKNPDQALMRVLDHCCRSSTSTCRAIPDQGPQNLRDSWKRALRDQLHDPSNWRSPHIVVPQKFRADWPTEDEVNVRCEPCGDLPVSGPYQRLLAILEKYEEHRLAIPDLDPWSNLKFKYSPDHGAPDDHPCVLPRPPMLESVRIEDLINSLSDARRQGWNVDGKYYYIPPDDWRPERICKSQWRNGYAFPQKNIDGWRGPTPIDFGGRIWAWDINERHWDVQIDPRVKVSHVGKLV